MKKLEVRLVHEPGRERVVGRLAETGRQLFFEYDPAFLREPLWLSPFKLPPEPGLVEHRDHDFGPVFGLFDDSLPEVASAAARWRVHARRADVGAQSAGAVGKALEQCLARR
ncbi:MAG: hypothetical protein GY856_26280 [bacterium]|nr:hypothetical protein [bacterium]